MNNDNHRVLENVFAAVEQNDIETIRSIYADNIRIWHSHDGILKEKDENIATLGALHLLGTLKYHILERMHSGSRVAQRHELTITSRDGTKTYRIDAAVFITIEDGRITAFDEYMDTKQLQVVGAAIAEAVANVH